MFSHYVQFGSSQTLLTYSCSFHGSRSLGCRSIFKPALTSVPEIEASFQLVFDLAFLIMTLILASDSWVCPPVGMFTALLCHYRTSDGGNRTRGRPECGVEEKTWRCRWLSLQEAGRSFWSGQAGCWSSEVLLTCYWSLRWPITV